MLQQSINTDRALALPRPRLRGVSHQIAFLLAIPLGIWFTRMAPPGESRAAVAVFTAGVATMFGISALVHLRPWSARVYEILFRLDHTGIYIAIAATATPIAVLGLDGWQQTALLVGSWAAAVLGIFVEWLPFATPRGFSNTVYLTMGWVIILLLPWVVSHVGVWPVVLLLAGGVLYTVGAVIVALRRPDPVPDLFGYHEIWHLLVIGAIVAHYLMVDAMLPTT